MTERDNFTIDLVHSDSDLENPANTLYKTCAALYAKTELVDCTISCSDGHLQAHRIVLASTSTYLCNLLTSTPLPTPCSHPILFLRNSSLADARCAMEYIYTGKTQTTKNRLSTLLEVSQELGCISLNKEIESAIQMCGIETFRRLAKTTNIKNNNIVSPSIKIEAEEPPQIITVKQDIFDEPEDYEEVNVEGSRFVTSSKNNPVSESIKRPIAELANGNNGLLHSTQSWKVPRLMNSNGNVNKSGIRLGSEHQNGSSKITSVMSLNLQHDKGESFVYNLDPLEQDEDENESGDEEEPETDVPQSLVNISDLLKGDIKEEAVPSCCPFCMQVFTEVSQLQKHIRSHVSKNFSCEYCHNTFARSAHLKRHLRTHTGEKPYVCSICQRPFARQDKLKTHLERHLVNAAKPSSNPMTITSYPPVSVSQNSGGQVPIKVLLPMGKQMNGTGSQINKFYNGVNGNQSSNNNSSNRFGIGTSNNNGLSISIANSISSENQRSVSSVAGGLIVTPANMPSSTTITPVVNGGGGGISSDCNKRAKVAKDMSRNFLVK